MVRPKKRLGQHFLRDENVAAKVAAAVDTSVPLLLEIGPGTGVLTKHLLKNPSIDLWVIEIDPESVEYLKATYPQLTPKIIEEDFLKFDLTLFPRTLTHTSNIQQCHCERSEATASSIPLTIVGNFPYNISSQILFRVLEHRDRVISLTGMFQREVARRIASGPGTKDYGILSVLLQAWYDIEYLFTVSEHVFFPPPKVQSAVIRMRRNQIAKLPCDEDLFFRVVKTAFNQRRKTLRNSLRQLLEEHGTVSSGPLYDKRPEQLSVDEFTGLAAALGETSGKKQ